MTETRSTMLPLGTEAPDFSLPDVTTGETVQLCNFSSCRVLLVMFICRHCPYVQHIAGALAKLGRDYAKEDIGIVAISSNDPEQYSDDDPDSLREMAVMFDFTFPLCHDASQEVAAAYSAACTPDFFLFDEQRKLVYRGQFDDSRPGNDVLVTGGDLRCAIYAALRDEPPLTDQKPSIGCSIKWKPGKEPKPAP